MKKIIPWLVLSLIAAPAAFGQVVPIPTDGPPIAIPFLGQIVALIVAIFGLVSAIVPDSKMPKIVAQIVNFLALNFGQARNAPDDAE